MNFRKKIIKLLGSEKIIFSLFFILAVFMTMSKHSECGRFNWLSEIFADKAGYYVYLPAVFEYGFDVWEFPDRIVERTGNGFQLDYLNNKIINKYTYGVAFLVSPFYFIAAAISYFNSGYVDGFSPVFYKMINICSVFYLTLGLYFLRKVLLKFVSPLVSYISVFIVFFSTNLLHYSIDETLMSHVYSFFLFSFLLYQLIQIEDDTLSIKRTIILGICISLIILIRLTNVFFVGSVILFFNVHSKKQFFSRVMLFLNPRVFLILLFIVVLFYIPQLLYWKYLTGHFIYYTHGSESFDNWNNPQFVPLWFAPNNGLFLYSPIVILFVISFFVLIKTNISRVSFLIFLIFSYVFASWETWDFGCSYGQRSFVEMNAIFIIPFAILIQQLMNKKRWILKIVFVFILFFSHMNIRMTFAYSKCFFGRNWEWKYYLNLLERSNAIPQLSKCYNYENNMEKDNEIVGRYAINEHTIIPFDSPEKGNHVSTIDSVNEYSVGIRRPLRTIGVRPIYEVESNVDICFTGNESKCWAVCFVLNIDNEIVYRQEFEIDVTKQEINSWNKLKFIYHVPKDIDQYYEICFYIWNPEKITAYVDQLQLKFKY